MAVDFAPIHPAEQASYTVNSVYMDTPGLRLYYEREPFVGEVDAYGRKTFDRAMRYRLMRGSYDLWAPDLVKRFSLVRRGYSKYRYAIDHCLERTGRGDDVAA